MWANGGIAEVSEAMAGHGLPRHSMASHGPRWPPTASTAPQGQPRPRVAAASSPRLRLCARGGAAVQFPVVIHVGPWAVPAHPVFETLGYTLGFQTFLFLRRRRGDALARGDRPFVILAAILGALV